MSRPPTQQRTDLWPLATLILANLIPLAGVFLWGWELTDLLRLYWVENAVIGLYTVLTLLTAWPEGESVAARIAAKVFMVPFFIVHYGMFWIGHGIFLMTFFGSGLTGVQGQPQGFFLSPVTDVLARADMLVWPVAAMLVSHGVAYVTNFLASGEYGTVPINKLMMRPYGRVVVLHVTIVIGGFLAAFLGPSQSVLLLFVIVKIVADVMAHVREERRVRSVQAATA